MQFYASPEQIMRDRSEYARKGIARGRSAIVLPTPTACCSSPRTSRPSLHKVSEIYDRIGFAAVGRYNEFENLRAAGVRMADLRGYSYDRRDVTGRALANAYAQTLGAIFTDAAKPFEVEICVAEVGAAADADELYRITYDGSVAGRARLRGDGRPGRGDLQPCSRQQPPRRHDAGRGARARGRGARQRRRRERRRRAQLAANQLEVAVLDRSRPVGRSAGSPAPPWSPCWAPRPPSPRACRLR